MNKLYRKTTTKGGRTKYQEAFNCWDNGDPKPGVWFVSGDGWRGWMCDHIQDIPDLPLRARLEDCRDLICREIVSGIHALQNGITTHEITTAVIRAIAERDAKK